MYLSFKKVIDRIDLSVNVRWRRTNMQAGLKRNFKRNWIYIMYQSVLYCMIHWRPILHLYTILNSLRISRPNHLRSTFSSRENSTGNDERWCCYLLLNSRIRSYRFLSNSLDTTAISDRGISGVFDKARNESVSVASFSTLTS